MFTKNLGSPELKNILLIGGSRGLGAALRSELSTNAIVNWTSRKPPENCINLNENFLNLHQTKSVETFATRLENLVFDQVIFCAAITDVGESTTEKPLGADFHLDMFETIMQINCYAPLRISQLLVAQGKLRPGAKLIFLSSKAGSIELRGKMQHHLPGGPSLYRISKAALNCGVKNLAFDLKKAGITVVAVHPGWVRTNQLNQSADTSALFAAKELSLLFDKISKNDTGRFLDRKGGEIAW